jgi:hypothetical protein
MDGMKRGRQKDARVVISEQELRFSVDEFYDVMRESIDDANPRPHMSADYLRSGVMRMGLQLFPVRTYEILRELNHVHRSGRVEEEEHPENAVAS